MYELRQERKCFKSFMDISFNFLPKLDEMHRKFLRSLKREDLCNEHTDNIYCIKVNPSHVNLQCKKKGCRFRFYFNMNAIGEQTGFGPTKYGTVIEVHQWHSLPLH